MILGAGFVGSRLATALESNEAARQADPALRRRVLATHRSDFSLQGSLLCVVCRVCRVVGRVDQTRVNVSACRVPCVCVSCVVSCRWSCRWSCHNENSILRIAPRLQGKYKEAEESLRADSSFASLFKEEHVRLKCATPHFGQRPLIGPHPPFPGLLKVSRARVRPAGHVGQRAPDLQGPPRVSAVRRRTLDANARQSYNRCTRHSRHAHDTHDTTAGRTIGAMPRTT